MQHQQLGNDIFTVSPNNVAELSVTIPARQAATWRWPASSVRNLRCQYLYADYHQRRRAADRRRDPAPWAPAASPTTPPRFNRSTYRGQDAIGRTGALVQARTGTRPLYARALHRRRSTQALLKSTERRRRLNKRAYARRHQQQRNPPVQQHYLAIAFPRAPNVQATLGRPARALGRLGLSGAARGRSPLRPARCKVSSGNGAGTNTITLGDGNLASSTTSTPFSNFGNAIGVIAAGPTSSDINAVTAVLSWLPRGQSQRVHGQRPCRPPTWTGAGANWTSSGNIAGQWPRHLRHRLQQHLVRQHDHQRRDLPAHQARAARCARSLGHRQRPLPRSSSAVTQTINGLSGSGGPEEHVEYLTIGAGNARQHLSGVIQNGSGTMTIVQEVEPER